MEQLNFSIPSKEFIEENFQLVLNELKKLKSEAEKNQLEEKKYYRNTDLKRQFGLSDNTIKEYRRNGTLPFTKLGEIYYYPVNAINLILDRNSNQGRIN